jgi:AhpD family alkylhydroperoxidase
MSDRSSELSEPRIRPGSTREIGLANALIARALGLASGGPPPNVFTTLARHRGLFRKWLVFAGGLMPGGLLKRAETELVILYVAQLMGCEYEWDHHVRLGKRAGLTDDAIERIRREEVDSPHWSARERALLEACRELHVHREIREDAFRELASHATEREIIELCLLVGNYQMLAMTLNTLRVPLDPR